ncbi:peptide-methionine (S)-S-oxide reductase MsrA [Zhihengliuella halotolerans]|uniref:Peptide methionine sulfoxide reductase MsrA n=1 Tax=Zhihengliuella halotolerans TaxID=370736 RepID=A0A4V2G9R6_9MICC|nr:peptide-methionine (S)-S-oxide reductase MsrA [Zhihengliuella halotolerans]RZU61456.1 peptide-methionine (S)-S-oxide reductase [Zhihengliuella halotolerans]
MNLGEPENRRTYYLGGGCFWCLDAVYRKLRGVTDVVSGYMGGAPDTANYRAVCGGATGHAEVVAVTFDPEVIPSDVVLDVFFATHDPTTLNRQGYDVGTQYRSVMFYETEAERAEFDAALRRHQPNYDAPIVTEVSRAPAFHEAESIHQDYYARNPGEGYCNVIINPKLSKVRRYYASWLVEGASH